MKKIQINNPGKLIFGQGCIDQMVSDYMAEGKKRIYVLSIAPVVAGLKNKLDKLTDAGIALKINCSLSSEPSFADFNHILADAKAFRPDSIVGLGGGSVMDLAKLLAVFVDNDDNVHDVVGSGLIKSRNIDLVCAPTTAGTGSEVSPNSILLDEQTGKKMGIISPLLVPDASYIDPELTLGVPPDITAYTGIDALTHCLEAYINKFSHPVTDLLALKGIALIYQSLLKACKDGNNIESRSNLALGSMYGGMCLGPVNTAAVHALAYPLGSDYNIPHGLSNAVLLPYVMQYNLAGGSNNKLADVARAIGVSGNDPDEIMAQKGQEKIKSLLEDCGVPASLRALGVKKDALKSLAESAMTVERLLKNNPRDISLDDAYHIYKSAY